MKGLELSRRYFDEVVRPAFADSFPAIFDDMAFGLAGAGSECLGFDDEISRDHDWGPKVCIWVSGAIYARHGLELQKLYESLPGAFLGYPPVQRLDNHPKRDGVLAIPDFLKDHLGTDHLPSRSRDWMSIPEEALSAFCAGAVFLDGPGKISALRDALKGYFPKSVLLSKAAVRCISAGRHGQYNLGRALTRGDRLAASYHKSQFSYDIAALAHIARRIYRPYGKWIFRSLAEADEGGERLYQAIMRLWSGDHPGTLKQSIDECAESVLSDLRKSGLPVDTNQFLYDNGLTLSKEGLDDE